MSAESARGVQRAPAVATKAGSVGVAEPVVCPSGGFRFSDEYRRSFRDCSARRLRHAGCRTNDRLSNGSANVSTVPLHRDGVTGVAEQDYQRFPRTVGSPAGLLVQPALPLACERISVGIDRQHQAGQREGGDSERCRPLRQLPALTRLLRDLSGCGGSTSSAKAPSAWSCSNAVTP